MTKNLEKADTIVKLTLSALIVVLFSIGLLGGPFGKILFALALLKVLIFIVQIIYAKIHKPVKENTNK